MGRLAQQADQRAQRAEQQLQQLTSSLSYQQQQALAAQEQAELEHIARLPVHEQALARAERAERKLQEFERRQQQQYQQQQEAAAAQAEAQRLLDLANQSYGLVGTDREIRAAELPQHAWNNRDSYIAVLATIGQQRQQEANGVAKPKSKQQSDGPDIQKQIEAGVQATLEKMGVSASNSAKPLRQEPVRDNAIQQAVVAPRNNARFKNEGPVAQQRKLKEIREQLAARVR